MVAGNGLPSLESKSLGTAGEARDPRGPNRGVEVGPVHRSAYPPQLVRGRALAAGLVLLVLMLESSEGAGGPVQVFGDVLPRLADRRFTQVRDGNTAYTLSVPVSVAQWEARAAELREHILACTGLWPPPEPAPLNAEVFGRIERDGYSIEKVYFESFPGFYVTGNLYRPLGRTGPFPGVISPHGHWARGRIHDEDLGSIPGRCITMARQGYVVFAYDMIGYNDSDQVAHSIGGEAEYLWGISAMGLQLRDSIRAVDFLRSLPDVDPARIGCTGASGGGTQTFMVAAVDDRIVAAAPVNMISAHFQGGCICENAPNLRIDTFNVEIGALMAPRPLLMVSCTGDWTANTPKVEFPAIQSVYRLLGAEDRVGWVQIDAPHNYNQASRLAVYKHLGKWLLGEDDESKLGEPPFGLEPDEAMLVWAGHERPAGALDQRGVIEALKAQARAQIAASVPRDAKELAALPGSLGVTLAHSLNVTRPAPGDVRAESLGPVTTGSLRGDRLVLGSTSRGDAVPAVAWMPPRGPRSGRAALVVAERGIASLLGQGGDPRPLLRGLLDAGALVLAIDAFGTGASVAANPASQREGVKFFTTFNRTDTAERVQDVLTAIAYLQSRVDVDRVDLVGLEKAGLWCLLARAFAPSVSRAALDLDGFPGTDEAYLSDLYVPLLLRAGGVQTAGALAAPGALLLHHVSPDLDLSMTRAAYAAADAGANLRAERERLSVSEVLRWLNR